MAREYTISGQSDFTSGTGTILALMPSATVGFEILRLWLGQTANATSAQQRVQMGTKVTAFQTVTSVTPAKLKINDPASGITGATTIAAGKCGVMATAEGGGGLTVIWEDAFNVLNGWLWVPTPKETIIMPPGTSSAFTLFFPTMPATKTNWTYGCVYAEI